MPRTPALDPVELLARYHARHGVVHLACPVCMRRKQPVARRRSTRR